MTVDDIAFWLTDPIRAGLPAALEADARWHGQMAVLGAGVLLPLAVLVARYFKILPGQDWPRELDRRHWWIGHLAFGYAGVLATLASLGPVVRDLLQAEIGAPHFAEVHGWFGWIAAAMLLSIVWNGWQRGTKGGPSRPPPPGSLGPLHGVAGDHYDMTERRRWFEHSHRLLGYLTLAVAAAAIISGLWKVNAPRWALVFVAAWWLVLLCLAWRWERQGRCIDSYQATWGPGMQHPGNRVPVSGWGVRRYTEEEFARLPWARHPARAARRAGTTAGNGERGG